MGYATMSASAIASEDGANIEPRRLPGILPHMCGFTRPRPSPTFRFWSFFDLFRPGWG